MPISADIRTRLVTAYNEGEGTYDEMAERFKIGRATVSRVLRRVRETGSVEAKPTGGRKPLLDDEDLESIHFIVLAEPDITLAQLRVRFEADGGRHVCPTTLWRALGRLGLSRKKSRSRRRNATART